MGLVDYPSTTAPETGTLTVTTQCVENAVESSPSLSVTCDSSGNWGNETPRCQCREGHTRVNQSGIEICLGTYSVYAQDIFSLHKMYAPLFPRFYHTSNRSSKVQ